MSIDFEWVDFYKELGIVLLEYKNNRHKLIEKIKNVFLRIDRPLPTLEEKGHDIIDIDPFTIYGLFNKAMRHSERYIIANGISKVPQHFDGIPTLLPLNAAFYGFANDRDENDIDNLWQLLESALNYVKDKNNLVNKENFSKIFDKVINQKHGSNRVTMALYWINPDEFLNMDSRNRWYIYKSGMIPENVVNSLPKYDSRPNSIQYLEIIEKIRNFLNSKLTSLNDFKELSTEAWEYSEKINKQKKENVQDTNEDSNVRTTHYWIYSPGENAFLWDEFYQKGVMGIGWNEIGNMSQYTTKEKIKDALKRTLDSSLSYKNIGYYIWQFVNEIKPGDIIFVKKGTSTIIGRY